MIRAWALLRDWWQYAQLEEREEPLVDALTRALAADAEHDAYALAEIRRWRDVAGEAARLAQEGTVTYHGMQCAMCDRTLMQGGNEEQRPYWVRVNEHEEPMSQYEIAAAGDDTRAIYEARCRECAGKAVTP